jgi:hypothetical protein
MKPSQNSAAGPTQPEEKPMALAIDRSIRDRGLTMERLESGPIDRVTLKILAKSPFPCANGIRWK